MTVVLPVPELGAEIIRPRRSAIAPHRKWRLAVVVSCATLAGTNPRQEGRHELDHVSRAMRDLARSLAFYASALAPPGITRLMACRNDGDEGRAHIGFGRDMKPFFRPSRGVPVSGDVHLAFAADDRAAAEAFQRAALAAGGRDNNAPGLRPQCHPGYYGAFVLDPDGCNAEAVHHAL